VGTDVPESLRELASLQCDVVSRQQILNAGVTKAALIWQLERAYWRQLQRGVYALFSGEPSREAALWAAVLRAGQDAVLSHHTAAELLRLTDKPSDLIHVTVPRSRRLQPIPGFAIHVSSSVDRIRHPGLLPPRTRVEDTVLDLAGLAGTFDGACGWVTRACGRRLTTEPRLLTAMAARGRQRWRSALAQMLTDPDGPVHSVLEYRYYRDVERAHRLPSAARQVRVTDGRRTAYRDAYYGKYRVVVELDGQLAHPSETRWRDIRRDNAAAADGSVTLRYGWSDVTLNPCGTAGELARVLIQRGWVGLPILCSAGCSVAVGWR
jgi:very-short-patch-repair endonuclease/predicted transcriptional regulator of viral defense system